MQLIRKSLAGLIAAGLMATAAPALAQSGSQDVPAPAAAAEAAGKKKAGKAGKKAKKAEPKGDPRAHQIYWDAVADKRRVRNAKRRTGEPLVLEDYVLTQPPPGSPPRRVQRDPVEPGVPRIPAVADFLKAAADKHRFVPERPESEAEFKRAYARIASAAGLTAEQAVGIYVFETGGNGTYDVQAGLTHPTKKSRPISPAIGYNQLLSTNSISLLAEHGDRFVEVLKQKAETLSGDAKTAFTKKIEGVQRMIAFSRSVPYGWKEHDKLAKTTRAGMGIHAAILDADLGPLMQTQKLMDSIAFARSKGHTAPLSAVDLEMMNLTGDGNGFDLVTMPPEWRDVVPTSNFFQPGGYTVNPIARRTGVVAALFAAMERKMNRASQLDGAKELAAAFAEVTGKPTLEAEATPPKDTFQPASASSEPASVGAVEASAEPRSETR